MCVYHSTPRYSSYKGPSWILIFNQASNIRVICLTGDFSIFHWSLPPSSGSHQAMSTRKMAGKDKATIAKEAQEEASNKQAAAEAAAKEATKLEAAAKVQIWGDGWGGGSYGSHANFQKYIRTMCRWESTTCLFFAVLAMILLGIYQCKYGFDGHLPIENWYCTSPFPNVKWTLGPTKRTDPTLNRGFDWRACDIWGEELAGTIYD